MSDPFFTVFKHHTDHNKWNKQKEFASIMEGVEETVRDEFISALDFLENEFGTGFLKQSSINHPVKQKISNKADWQIHELIRFAASLQTLKAANSNYPKLKSKLLSFQKSKIEGIPFIEIAQTYLNENFTVFFPDENNITKSPDIEITNPINNDKFFIEVSMIQESDEREHLGDNYHFLHHQFHIVSPYAFVTGKQKESFAKEDYKDIAQLIADIKKQVEEKSTVVSYSDNRFEFWIATESKLTELDKIAEQNRTRRNEVNGMPLNFDETDRLINNKKIKHEAEQIPIDSNGIIYFPVNPLFFMTTDLANAVIRLEQYIAKFQNLLGIVLYSKILDQQEEVFQEIEKHFFSRKMTNNILCRELLFVYNHNCNLMIKEETLKKIYDTFK